MDDIYCCNSFTVAVTVLFASPDSKSKSNKKITLNDDAGGYILLKSFSTMDALRNEHCHITFIFHRSIGI